MDLTGDGLSGSHGQSPAQQGQGGSDSTPATQPGDNLRLMMDNISCALTFEGGLRRSSRVSTRTQKVQDALTSTGTNQGPIAPNVKGASTKVDKKNTAKHKPDSSAPLNKQVPSNPQGKPSTQAKSTRQDRGKPSISKDKMGPRNKKAPNSPTSGSSSDSGEDVEVPSPPSPSPFYDPAKAGHAQRGGHGGTGRLPASYQGLFSSAHGHRVQEDVSGDKDAMDITDDVSQPPVGMNAAYMAGSQVHGGGHAHVAAGGPQAARPKSPPPVLYDYQVEHVAKALAAANKLKDAIETMRKQNPTFDPVPSIAGPPLAFGPVSPPGMAPNQAPKVGYGPTQFPQASAKVPKKKPETIEDIRRNMTKLLDDDPISDMDFMRQHYQDEGSKKRLREALAPLRGVFSSGKPVFKDHTATQYMAQRADSSTHAKLNGEQPPNYAYVAPETDDKGKPLAKKKKTPEDVAAKVVKDFDKANRDYDDAFERNLRSMFD